LRISDLCEQHRCQQLKSSVGEINNRSSSNNNNNKFQQLKQAHLGRAPPVIVPSTPRNITIRTKTTSNRFLTMAGSLSNESDHRTKMIVQPPTATHVNQPLSVKPSGQTVPMHMTKTESNTNLQRQRRCQVNEGVLALKERQITANHTIANKRDHDQPSSNKYPTRKGDWLQEAMLKKAVRSSTGGQPLSAFLKNRDVCNNKIKRRRVCTDGGGFDGSVPVPRPSQFFQTIGTMAVTKAGSASTRPLLEEKQEHLLQRQTEVARLRKEGSSMSNNSTSSIKKTNSFRKVDGKQISSQDEFLAAWGGCDHDKVRNAKSRFASEIEAEQYAASRQKVIELEKLEERQETKAKHKSKEEDHKRLSKEWRCQSCGQSYSILPKHCYRAGHQVHLVRSIRTDRTKEESRTLLHTKRSDDGGLQLGAGLEWSSNRYAENP
jgi:hypothetical protein